MKTPVAAKAVDPLKGLQREYDKMQGIAWYRSANSPRYLNANGVFLYFGKEDTGKVTPMHLSMQYRADDWLFITTAWAKADGIRVDLPQKSGRLFGWERDSGGGSIWEWSDASLTDSQAIDVVKKLSQAKDVTIRFEGKQYYKDKVLSAQQLKAMRDMITAYEGVTGKPWK
jgi:hypothetical protein